MNKVRKALSFFMIVMMLVSSMVMTAFATEKPDDRTKDKFTITKIVSGIKGSKAPVETYNFTILPKTVPSGTTEQNGKINVYTGIDLGAAAAQAIAFDGTETITGGTATKSIEVNLADVHFSKAGIYRYEVKETAGTMTGMTYDGTVYIADVYVGYNANDQLVVEGVKAVKAGQCQKVCIQFKNVLATQCLKVEKQVTGNQGDRTKLFNFTLDVTACNALPQGSVLAGVITKQDGSKKDITMTVGTTYEFTLADDENLVMTGLPLGVSYKVVEKEANQDGYTTTMTDAGKGVICAKGNKVTIVNDRSATTPTGILLNIAPFAVMILLAAAAAVMFFIKKRNSYYV